MGKSGILRQVAVIGPMKGVSGRSSTKTGGMPMSERDPAARRTKIKQ